MVSRRSGRALSSRGREIHWASVDAGIPKQLDGTSPVYALLEDRQATLWIGAEDGIYRRTSGGATEAHPVQKNGIAMLYQDREGRIWASDYEALYRLNPNAGVRDPIVARTYTSKDGLPGDRIEALLQSSDGRLWAAGGGLGLYVPATDTFESYTTAQGLSDPAVKSLAEDNEGNLWAGGESAGVMKIARRGFTSYTQADGLDSTRIPSIFVDRAAELCVVASGTDKTWIDCLNGKRFTSIHPKYPDTIHNFGWGWNQIAFQDHAGEWWLPTGEGLCWFG